MLLYFEIFLLIVLVFSAIAVSFTKDNLSTVIVFTTFSLAMSILWVVIKSPDLAITEAAVGAGITSLLFFIVLKNVGEIGTKKPLKKSKNDIKLIKNNMSYKIFSILFTVGIIAVLLITVSYLPLQGDPNNPAINEVFTRYIEAGVKETGAINLVASIILDYRAFDTFGEAAMLFTAIMAVVTLLRVNKKEKDYEENNR